MQTSGSSAAGGSSALPVPSSEKPAKISKEMQEFGDKFTQSIIAQFQRCLVPIEEKLARVERNEERILEFERQFSKMNEKNSDDFEIRQTFKFESGSEAKNENFSRRESFGSSAAFLR